MAKSNHHRRQYKQCHCYYWNRVLSIEFQRNAVLQIRKKVYERTNYQNYWGGKSPNNKLGKSGMLPTGTYYYIIDVISEENPTEKMNGYIYLGGN